MKRKDYISWEEYFMGIATLSAMRSKDPITTVGACIVSSDNRIISVGYNGFPNGCSDEDLPWSKTSPNENETKYPYVVHAETNAILNSKHSLKDCILYVTLFPCADCTKNIIQSGIRKIVYYNIIETGKYLNSAEASKKMLKLSKVEFKQFNILNKNIIIKT